VQKFSKIFLFLLFIYWLPFFIVLSQYNPYETLETLPESDAVIVFGTLVRGTNVSSLLKERLDASIAIYKVKKVQEIVVSNTPKAALVMREYLIKHHIPNKDINLDINAEKTPDT